MHQVWSTGKRVLFMWYVVRVYVRACVCVHVCACVRTGVCTGGGKVGTTGVPGCRQR